MIGLQHLLYLSAILFIIGVAGFITRRNVIIMFMSVELMLNAANVALVGFAYHFARMDAQLIALTLVYHISIRVSVSWRHELVS